MNPTAAASGIRRWPPAVRSAGMIPSSTHRFTDDSLTPTDSASWWLVRDWAAGGMMNDLDDYAFREQRVNFTLDEGAAASALIPRRRFHAVPRRHDDTERRSQHRDGGCVSRSEKRAEAPPLAAHCP